MTAPVWTANLRQGLVQQLALLRYQARRLGWSGLAGAALALLALFFQLTVVSEAQQAAEGARSQIEALSQTHPAKPGAAPSTDQNQLETLHRFFPGSDAREAALVRIHTLAGEHGLSLESGDYREIAGDIAKKNGAGSLVKYQLSLPLSGPYPALRAWLAAVMNEMPTVALEDFSLKRDTVANPVVDARVRFTLYFEER